MNPDHFKTPGVLIVDDDAFILDMTASLFLEEGFLNVKTATSAMHALTILQQQPYAFELILCDLRMPEMDGVQFLRHLAQRHYEGGIILASGEDTRLLKTAVELARVHSLNIIGSIPKPVSMDAIQKLLLGFEPLASYAVRPPPGPELGRDDLIEALEKNQLLPFFQPKVSVAGSEVLGFEVLARWDHPRWGMIPPMTFIALAEQTGLINQVTHVIFTRAIEQFGNWKEKPDLANSHLGLNVSMQSFEQLNLPDFVLNCAGSNGVGPESLVLEVTESRLMQNVVATLESLARLRLMGVGLSIDDFGTGYSTMEQLKKIPFGELKIDRAFVNGALNDASARAILEASIHLGKKLAMSIVAEGVETREDWDLVAELGCDIVQGYFVARPMPAGEVADWAVQWRKQH